MFRNLPILFPRKVGMNHALEGPFSLLWL